MKQNIFLIFTLLLALQVRAGFRIPINPDLLAKDWDAQWITAPATEPNGMSILHFRKSFQLASKPEHFIIHISADNRYRLFVNGQPVAFGPARSDLRHWNFETIDIATQLKTGVNTLAAVVWNFGNLNPQAQMSYRTGFIAQGNTKTESIINTGSEWKVFKNESYKPLIPVLPNYIDVGPGEYVDGEKYPWNWERTDFDDSHWVNAQNICKGRPKGKWSGPEWDLVPRDIPMMEETEQRFQAIRHVIGIQTPTDFISGKQTLVIPANTAVSILFDQGVETVAYPELLVSSGQGAEIELIYAEGLFNKDWTKGNRNETEGKFAAGITDRFKVGSTSNEFFRPLWFRTFRYVQMNIQTQQQPLIIRDFKSIFTAYPFQQTGSFKCNDDRLNKIWETGWRTLRLCSNETHYDCPYYEQLQYVGDTRIQGLISAYVSNDDRLIRKAIQLFDYSRMHEGLTNSRYPSRDVQIISPFSLFWINMVHDYWMLKNDPDFVKQFLFGTENILHWYTEKINHKTNMLGKTPYWNFVDWPDEWAWSFETNSGGVPQNGAEGGSSILTFQLAYTLNNAAEFFEYYGKTADAKRYRELAKRLNKATVASCWDNEKQRVADSPYKNVFSQHANIMAILAGADLPVDKKLWLKEVANDSTLIQATIYYKFYLFMAMKKAGLSDMYIEMIKPWNEMLDNGLTTFSERLDPTRSDCHAWSASPTYDLLATVCGIEPAEPGFKSVLIRPNLANLEWVEGSIPHPKGMISVSFRQTKQGTVSGKIILPEGIYGKYIHNGKKLKLTPGINIIK